VAPRLAAMNNPEFERPYSAAAERNQGPILAHLQRWWPPQGVALEIASGTGQHAAHFAAGLPGWRWLPSDGNPASMDAIQAWCGGLANVAPPLLLDVLAPDWPGVPTPLDALYCANMLHISPWATCAALMQGAARHLGPGGVLVLYGPYLEDDVPTAPSNLAFDADLKSRHPAWGLRRLADVAMQARAAGLTLKERVPMPANNLLLAWTRAGAANGGSV